MNKIVIGADGGCRNNGQKNAKGGWGCVITMNGSIDGTEKQLYGGELNTTNQRMELLACINALDCLTLKSINMPVEIYSDSAYVCNCFKEGWYIKWRKNNWINSQRNPVENKDLWMKLLRLYEIFTDIKIIKVKGHAGNALNELADSLANKGMDEL